jgi:predicted Zn-dependent protease
MCKGAELATGHLVKMSFSREHETEADSVGIELAARAGYNPRAGISLWKKMTVLAGDGTSLFWLSTHPPCPERVENMKELANKYFPLYERAIKSLSVGESDGRQKAGSVLEKGVELKDEALDMLGKKAENALSGWLQSQGIVNK